MLWRRVRIRSKDGSTPSKDLKARVVILRRIDRLLNGNFGDHKFCQDGVWELRIDFGPGYRVYYALSEKTVILLLCRGSKRNQSQISPTRFGIGKIISGDPY